MQTDKKFQRADWRLRPLTPAMLAYARIDTHFLLYIADVLRQLLLKAGSSVPASLGIPLPVVGPQVLISRNLISSSCQQCCGRTGMASGKAVGPQCFCLLGAIFRKQA
jgi:hypothetical protein